MEIWKSTEKGRPGLDGEVVVVYNRLGRIDSLRR